MYRNHEVFDLREMLRVKVKSLAAEAAIIRREEQRSRGTIRNQLHEHRVGLLRREARSAHLAYGFIRGRSLGEMEQPGSRRVDWPAVHRMVRRYGNAESMARFSKDLPLLEAANVPLAITV